MTDVPANSAPESRAPGDPAEQAAALPDGGPSRPFILRPVATTLLMIALLLAGVLGLSLPAAVGAARGRLPDDPGAHAVSRREPRRDGADRHRPLERQFGQMPGLARMTSQSLGGRFGDHAAVRARPVARRRRAGSPGGDQRRQHAAAEPTCRRRRSMPRSIPPTRRCCRSGSPPRPGRWAKSRPSSSASSPTRSAQVSGVGLVVDLGRAAARGAHPGQRSGARRAQACSLETIRTAIVERQRQRRQGQLRRRRPRAGRSTPTTSSPRPPNTRRWCSPTRTARRCVCPTSPTSSIRPRTRALGSWMNKHPGGDRRRPAPARAPTSSARSTRSRPRCPSSRRSFPPTSTSPC